MPLCFIEPQDAIRVIAESVGREARRQLLGELVRAWVDEIPESELASHYAKAVADLDEHDLSMLAAWHASLEVGHPIANKDFLVGAFPTLGREPPRGAEDRRRLPRRGGVRRGRGRGAGAGDACCPGSRASAATELAAECLELYCWDRLGSRQLDGGARLAISGDRLRRWSGSARRACRAPRAAAQLTSRSSTNTHASARQRRGARASARRSRGSGLRMPTNAESTTSSNSSSIGSLRAPQRLPLAHVVRAGSPAAARGRAASRSEREQRLVRPAARRISARRSRRSVDRRGRDLGSARAEQRRGTPRSVIWPRSSSNSGVLAARARERGAIAVPQRLQRDAGLRWSRANASISGGVSTPPKSRDDRPCGLTRGAARRSGPTPVRPSMLPAQERAVQPQRAELERRAAQRLARRAARVVVVLADPELQAGAELAARRRRTSWTAAAPDRTTTASRSPAPSTSAARDRRRRSWPAARARIAPSAPATASPSSSQRRHRARQRERVPVRAPHACPRWPSARRTLGAADARPAHAAELLVALQPPAGELRGGATAASRRRSSASAWRTRHVARAGAPSQRSKRTPPAAPSSRARRRPPRRPARPAATSPRSKSTASALARGGARRRRAPGRRARGRSSPAPGRRRRTSPHREAGPAQRAGAARPRRRSPCARRSGPIVAGRCRRRRSPGGRADRAHGARGRQPATDTIRLLRTRRISSRRMHARAWAGAAAAPRRCR